MMQRPVLFFALLCLWGCDEVAAELLVRVDSELEATDMVYAVIDVEGGRIRGVSKLPSVRPVDDGGSADSVTLPFWFVVYPDEPEVLVAAEARRTEEDTLVRQALRVTVPSSGTLNVRLTLSPACIDGFRTCSEAAGYTCVQGSCAPLDGTPALDPTEPIAPEMDGGTDSGNVPPTPDSGEGPPDTGPPATAPDSGNEPVGPQCNNDGLLDDHEECDLPGAKGCVNCQLVTNPCNPLTQTGCPDGGVCVLRAQDVIGSFFTLCIPEAGNVTAGNDCTDRGWTECRETSYCSDPSGTCRDLCALGKADRRTDCDQCRPIFVEDGETTGLGNLGYCVDL